MKTAPLRPFASVFLALGVSSSALAQTTWDAQGGDANWSNFINWSTDLSPSGTPVVFGAAGTTANATSVGNVVDSGYAGSLSSLTYNQTGAAAWQVTQIGAGQTLTVSGAFRVGTTQAATGLTTLTALTGAGSLVVNDTASSFTVSGNVSSGSNIAGRATLDMSGLGGFSANVALFNVGTGAGGFGTLYLAQTSTITADTVTAGGSGDYNSNSTVSNRLYLGDTTTINATSVLLANGRTPGLVQFRPASSGANASAASNPALVIRGKTGGASRAILSVGDLAGGSSSQNGTSQMDLTAGSVDAMVSTFTLGRSDGTLNGNYGAIFSMAAGTFDATEARVAEVANSNAGTGSVTGTVNVSGGTFKAGVMTLGYNTTTGTRAANGVLNVSGAGVVNVTGDLVMGRRNGAIVGSTLNISGGSVTVGGNLAEGAGAGSGITSVVNLGGGVLDLTGGNIAVDTFNFTAGELRNVASFSAGTSGGLNVQNAATLGFQNIDGTFVPMALTGGFALGANANLNLSLANDFTPASTFLLVSNDGGDSITGTFATVNGLAVGVGNSFSLTNNLGTYNFVLNYTGGDGNDLVASWSAIPEPSAWGLVAGLAAIGAIVRRRRRS